MDHILSYIDKPSLSACSVVSHHWRPSAQMWLFRTVYIFEDRSGDLERFRNLTLSEDSSNVMQHVRELRLLGNHNGAYLEVAADTVGLFVSKMPALRTLKLGHVFLADCKEISTMGTLCSKSLA